MEKKTLLDLFSQKLLVIPDYQRGYAWETKQWNDFFQDVDALRDEKVKNHYCGTVVTYEDKSKKERQYSATDRLKIVDVVDGQQRLTTSCLFLSIVIRRLVDAGETGFAAKVPDFLYSDNSTRLTLNNDTNELFLDLLKSGRTNARIDSTHQKRLLGAHEFIQQEIDRRLKKMPKQEGLSYLKSLYDSITRKLVFTFYTIEEECEIGMTFELMNSRGKDLSVLELLKNYLMHWISRNELDDHFRETLTETVNRNWKDTYVHLGNCDGLEDQCLRVAWILYCSHTPKNWDGYEGFKDQQYIPLRDFKLKTKEETREFISRFTTGLSEIARHYSTIFRPTESNTMSPEELKWLSKIRNAGNVANFLALIIAARTEVEKKRASVDEYIDLLKALECFSCRVFLFEGKRSIAGKSKFFLYASSLFNDDKYQVSHVPDWIYSLILHYSPADSFSSQLQKPAIWYKTRKLKYVLFEYELHLLETEGKGKKPALQWNDLSDSTIEHILPQNPKSDSHWKAVWPADSVQKCLHDIGNLVLTQNNSNYLNFDFERKRGTAGKSPSYIHSDIRQERKISRFEDWTPVEFQTRRDIMVAWIADRWKTIQIDEVGEIDHELDEESDLDRLELE